jgi:hypothetical protein
MVGSGVYVAPEEEANAGWYEGIPAKHGRLPLPTAAPPPADFNPANPTALRLAAAAASVPQWVAHQQAALGVARRSPPPQAPGVGYGKPSYSIRGCNHTMAARSSGGVRQPVLADAVLPAHMSHLLTERDDAVKKAQLKKQQQRALAQKKQKAEANAVGIRLLAAKGLGATEHEKYHTHTGAIKHSHRFAD